MRGLSLLLTRPHVCHVCSAPTTGWYSGVTGMTTTSAATSAFMVYTESAAAVSSTIRS